MLHLSNWYNTFEFYEIEHAYDPSYLNLDPNDPDAWEVYAQKVRTIMSKMLDLPMEDKKYAD